jgi:cholesterol transport system auxiliary component
MGALGGCALPDKPLRATSYDFGPGTLTAAPAGRGVPQPALVVAEVDASPALDSTAVLYRLAYADAQALRPYAQARWSMPPAQLLRQRLREHLGQRRVVLNAAEGNLGGASPWQLRIELEEFSQLFETPTTSAGLLRLRATVVQATPQGEKLAGQRVIVMQRPAPSADAPGGVRALTAATDAAVLELDQWLQELR